MPKTTRHVLKADQIALSDPLRLGLDPAVSAACDPSRSAAAVSQVRIVQSHTEYAVIELICSCGRTTRVRCDYAAAAPTSVREPARGQAVSAR